jgi:hypothetical protein
MRTPNSGKLSQQVFWNKKIQAMRDRRGTPTPIDFENRGA